MVPLLRSLSFPAAILLVAGVLSGCQAATNAPVSAEVLMDKAGQTILLEDFSYPDTNEPQVTSSIVTLEPGAETGLHFHEAPMYAYILEGTLEVTYQREGGEETKFTVRARPSWRASIRPITDEMPQTRLFEFSSSIWVHLISRTP